MTDGLAMKLLPGWVTSLHTQDAEKAAFSSGAALALLDRAVCRSGGAVPALLLRDRLALKAAAACLKIEGRGEGEADIRDAICLTRAGDATGPAGDMFLRWRKLTRINLRSSGWAGLLARLVPEHLTEALAEFDLVAGRQGSPAAQAGDVLAQILNQFPREEATALMLAEVVLARAIGWAHPVPLLAAHLRRRDLRAISIGAGDPVHTAHLATIAASDVTIRMAADLTRRVAALHAVAPRLRSKGAAEALSLFLSLDAVSPSGVRTAQINAMTDRSARRFCDRLVDLGAVRELTGRPTFRLYGL